MAVTSRPIIALPVGGRLLRPDPPGPAPSCTVTLTSDYAAGFGLQPMTVDGQTLAAESNGGASFIGGTDVNNPAPVTWSGRRAIQLSITDSAFGGTPSNTFAARRTSDFVGAFAFYNHSSGEWTAGVSDGGGSFTGDVSGIMEPVGAKCIFVIDGDSGDAEIWIGGTKVADKNTVPDNGDLSTLGAMFSGASVFVSNTFNGGPAGNSITVTFDTAAADIESANLPAGDQDWCGNAI